MLLSWIVAISYLFVTPLPCVIGGFCLALIVTTGRSVGRAASASAPRLTQDAPSWCSGGCRKVGIAGRSHLDGAPLWQLAGLSGVRRRLRLGQPHPDGGLSIFQHEE